MRRLQRRLQRGDPLRVLTRQLAEVPLAAEPIQLEVLTASHRCADALHRLDVREFRVPLVDRTQVEVGLEPGVVPVVLVVELRDEAVGTRAVVVELAVGGRRLAHRA